MDFQPGDQLVWVHRPRGVRQPQRILAELVQPGRLRARIRIQLAQGATALRWVKPENLYRTELKRSLGSDRA